MKTRPPWFYSQSAAVPYRTHGGLPEMLLITSRSGKRWTIPKGVVEVGMTASASAAKEAFEEAGVRGDVGTQALGSYVYKKWGGTCTVEVYTLCVHEVLDTWPEAQARLRRWLPLEAAATIVTSNELRRILRALAKGLRGNTLPSG